MSSAVAAPPSTADYLHRPAPKVPESAPPPWADQLKFPTLMPTPAGLAYLQLGLWPPWLNYLLTSAMHNTLVTYYFIGPYADVSGCSNCVWLHMDVSDLEHRIKTELGVVLTKRTMNPRKLSDLKPMLGALLPELAARHKWFGYADPDVLFGNLSHEVGRLRDDEDMLVPRERAPLPLANGNFMLLRTSEKMLNAFKRNPDWKAVLKTPVLQVFDEWRYKPIKSIYVTYYEMLMSGEISAVRSATRMFMQDAIIIRGITYPTIDHPRKHVSASNQTFANAMFRGGRLVATRRGPCHCPRDVVPQPGLNTCPECLDRPGELMTDVLLDRTVEILGVHFQEWKKIWRRSEEHLIGNGNGTRAPFSEFIDPVPPCALGADFDLAGRYGFRCMSAEGRAAVHPGAKDAPMLQPPDCWKGCGPGAHT